MKVMFVRQVITFLGFAAMLGAGTAVGQGTGAISGTVTGSDEVTPLSGLTIQAYRYSCSPWCSWFALSGATATSGVDGTYTLTGLTQGMYRVLFASTGSTYVRESYDDIQNYPSDSDATSIEVLAGQTTSGIDASLYLAGELSGIVTGPDELTPLEYISVLVYRWDSDLSWWTTYEGGIDYTGPNGSFSIGSLPPGTYRLNFTDGDGQYIGETYDNYPGDAYNGGTSIVLSEGQAITNLDVSLAAASKITGMVTGPDEITPLGNIQVQAYQWQGFYWMQLGGAAYDFTSTGGVYTLGGLSPGTYRVQFRDDNGEYATETYDNVPGQAYNGGTSIVVQEGQIVSNINASLAVGAMISGVVTGPDGTNLLQSIYVEAYIYTGSGWSYAGYDFTDIDGAYTIGGLVAGDYRLVFDDFGGDYLGETYDDHPGSPYTGGNTITLTAGQIVSNINASLSAGGIITGTVTGPDGSTPLENIYVYAWQDFGVYWSAQFSASTGPDGTYELSHLRGGQYRIEFQDYSGQFVSEVYDDYQGSYRDGGDWVDAIEGQAVSNINASLAEYAMLAGTVVANGALPVPGVAVRARDALSGDIERTAWTDGSGNYQLVQVPPGNYVLQADPTGDGNHLGLWHTNLLYRPWDTIPPTGAQVYVLSGGEMLTNLNFDLPLAGRITGVVTAASLFPLEGARVKAYGLMEDTLAQTMTDTGGTYEIRGLFPDTYEVKAEAAAYQDEWWTNAPHRDLATPVGIATGTFLNLDFDLAPGQSPGLVEITSDPSGAEVFFDFLSITSVTPVVLDVGEFGDQDALGAPLAPHIVTVRKSGHPFPSPKPFQPIEAETINLHFDLTDPASGSLLVETTPDQAEVYVDIASPASGLSPVMVTNLAPGSHVIVLRKPGYLQPRPVRAWVTADETNTVEVPLAPDTGMDNLTAEVESVPPDAAVYVDYLPTTNVTDVIVDWMDAASHAGSGWHSASHTILLRRPGFRPVAPRYVADDTNQVHWIHITLPADPEQADDDNADGLPDAWQDAYGLTDPTLGLTPQEMGPDGDPDGDFISNEDELEAGTNPLDGNSGLSMAPPIPPSGEQFSITFNTVPGRSYLVLCSGDLTGSWVQASGVLVATGTQTTWTTTLAEGQVCRYFRILVLTP